MNNTENNNNNLEEDSQNEITIYLHPGRLILSVIFGWILLPLILKEVISSRLLTVYIIWIYSFFNIKCVGMWIGHFLKAPFMPTVIFRGASVGKLINFIYIVAMAAVQILIFVAFIRHIYLNQATSVLFLILTIVQPLLSDLASFIGNTLFFKRNESEDVE